MSIFSRREICFKVIAFYFSLITALLAVWFVSNHYLSKTPDFLNPVTGGKDGQPVLRNDDGGKGYFGASRNGGRTHTGIDILADMEAPVYAATHGRVVRSFVNGGYGEFIEIQHYGGRMTRYAHLTSRHVSKGQWVLQGQQIGTIGKSGNAVDEEILPHLHFEIRLENRPVDPTNMISSTPSAI